MSSFALLTWLALSYAAPVSPCSGKLLLVSMDGFRWDYLNKVYTPNFANFAKQGVRLPYMNTTFVTTTFASHFTMITGLYVEDHGVIDGVMYDPCFKETFHMGTDPRWWSGGEPLWVTAKKQGLKTATYYWPGSETQIQGIQPDIWFPYTNPPPFKKRVGTVVDWFRYQNVKLATMYYSEPDGTGHLFGPDSPEVRAKVREMDDVLGYLLQKMKESGLENEVNVIVTSDHGMTAVDNVNRVVDVTDYVDMAKIQRVPTTGALMQIQPQEGEEEAVFESLQGVPHITVYRKQDIPEHFHYKNNRRIMPIIVLADEGWTVTTDKKRQATSPRTGRHGYDNRLPSMKPIFLARGPDFKTNFVADPISIVDIYPLACKLLNIFPSANNGSLERVSAMLRKELTNLEIPQK